MCNACAVLLQAGYTATWRMNRTLPVPARAQLRMFFSNVWHDRQGAGQIYQSIELSVPKLVVILHYVVFMMNAIQKISDGKKEVDSRYHLGSGIYVTSVFQYRNVCVRYWKTANGKIYSSEPCIQDEDRSGHDMNSCEECKTAQKNFCRGEVKEDIPL